MSNNESLQKQKKKHLIFSYLFFGFHVSLIIFALFILFSGRVKITTDFLSLLPNNGISENVSKAEKIFASKQNAKVNILVGHHDFEVAKENAIKIYDRFNNSGVFDELSLSNEAIDISSISSFITDYRYQLLPKAAHDEILNDIQEFQNNSLGTIFSPLTFSSLENLNEDPFMIDNAIYLDILNSAEKISPVMPKEDVLAVEFENVWYVLLQGTLSAKSLNIANTKGGIDEIYAFGDSLTQGITDLTISYSGFPFHSFESSSNAQKEITYITVVSIALIILLFIILIRNIHIVGFFLISTFCALTSAFAALFIFFPEIHVLTMIFGTTLIGTSIDYAIHFYVAYANRKQGENGFDVAKGLSVNLSISFLSTVICYVLILFNPYDILKQVAVFSSFGLISSFLAVMGLFPLIIKPNHVSKNAIAWKLQTVRKHRSYTLPLLIIAMIIFAFSIKNVKIENKINNLYQMSDRLLNSEKTVGQVMGFMSSTYAIIEGKDEAAAREIEYQFSKELNKMADAKEIDYYLSPSLFIPPPSVQKDNLKVSRNLISIMDNQCEILGLDSQLAKNALLNNNKTLKFSNLPESLASMLNQLIPGEINGKYYIVVFVFGAENTSSIAEFAARTEGVNFFQKSTDINKQLDLLTKEILKIFLFAFGIIVVALLLIFKKKGLLLAFSPIITIALVISSAPIFGLSFDFFYTVGLLLSMGLGLDYMVFAGNNEKKPLLAITLSYITTALSFGTLLFSSFVPVHVFGLSVFIGITVAYLTALCAASKD